MVSHGWWVSRGRPARLQPRMYLVALLSFFTSSLFVINVHQARPGELGQSPHPEMAMGVSYGAARLGQELFPGRRDEEGRPGVYTGAEPMRSGPGLRQAMGLPAAYNPVTASAGEEEAADEDPVPAIPQIKEPRLIGNARKPSRTGRKWDKLRMKYTSRAGRSPPSVHLPGPAARLPGTGGPLRELANLSMAELGAAPGELWPGNYRGDRVLAQMLHIPAAHQNVSADNDTPSANYKKIYVFNGLPDGTPSGERKFQSEACPVRSCFLSDNVDDASSADVILFSGLMGFPVKRKPSGQLWVLFLLESPVHTQDLVPFAGLVNWTATYRRDSTLVTPYEKFVPYTPDYYYSNNSQLPYTTATTTEPPARNYAAGKTKKVAWFVSNCHTTNGRLAYARELARHIDVDIYGDCGRMRCPRTSASICFDMLRRDYKFYLSFENSNCRDYITEKFFTNALANDVIPIAMGAHPDDYQKVAPPKSFIHVDSFRSPKELAYYLHALDRNDTLYNEYFKWKDSGRFINTKFWCRLCSLIHGSDGHVTWYDNLRDWWSGNDMCRKNQNDRTWSSWRGR